MLVPCFYVHDPGAGINVSRIITEFGLQLSQFHSMETATDRIY